MESEWRWLFERMWEQQEVVTTRFDDLNPSDGVERKCLESLQVSSFLAIPMTSGGRLLGFWGLESVHRQMVWEQDILALLKVSGELFAGALERKRIEEELRKSEARFRATFEQSAVGIAVADLEGRLIEVNAALAVMLGYRKTEAVVTFPISRD